MSNYYPPAVPQPPVTPSGNRKAIAIAAAVVGGLCTLGLVGVGVGVIGAAVSGDDPVMAATTTTSVAAPVARVTTSAAPRYDVPTATNLTPELTVTEKKCFGSAGCIFEYELRLTKAPSVTFDPAKTYRVTLTIDEGTSWEQIKSIEVKGTKADVLTGRVSTDTQSTPEAVITAVVARP